MWAGELIGDSEETAEFHVGQYLSFHDRSDTDDKRKKHDRID
jgi:hypothetical protein